jgi:hypothetical protein
MIEGDKEIIPFEIEDPFFLISIQSSSNSNLWLYLCSIKKNASLKYLLQPYILLFCSRECPDNIAVIYESFFNAFAFLGGFKYSVYFSKFNLNLYFVF